MPSRQSIARGALDRIGHNLSRGARGFGLLLALPMFATPARAALPVTLETGGHRSHSAEDPQAGGLEVLRFTRNAPGSVVPVDLSTFALRATVWDLTAITTGPVAITRSIMLFSVAPDAGSSSARWRTGELLLDAADEHAPATGPTAGGMEGAIPSAFGDNAPLGPAPPPHLLGERWMSTAFEGDDLVTVSAAVLGEGWAQLPAGAVRCFLIGERLAIDRAPYGSAGPEDTRAYRYRWESPRLGTVATVQSVDGDSSPDLRSASLVERLASFRPEAFPLHLYSDRIPRSTLQTLNWSYESGGPVSGMTPEAYATAGDLVTDGGGSPPTWELTTPQDTSTAVRAGSQVPVSESCYAACCGFSTAGNDFATRSDNPASGGRGFTAVDRVTGTTDRFFFRAVVAAEGDATNELRSCFDGSASHNSVVAYDFQHTDAGRFYMQKSDFWANSLKTCSQDVWQGGNCSSCSSGTAAYVSRRSPQTGITASVIGEGVLTLPSGHHFDALLLLNTNDFTVYADPFCSFIPVQTVHQFTYAWLVPFYGNVATLSSDLNVPDSSTWTTGGTSINFSLLPPVSISATGSACDRISLSWNPGSDASRITRYKIYWGTQSGSSGPYSFNSDSNSGQVAILGTTATISGLTRGTNYYFTVTSLADYRGHTYESLLYPTQISGTTPASAYPAEILAPTASAPTTQVTGVTVGKAGSGSPIDVTIAWSPSSNEGCLDRYSVFEAADPRPAVPPGSFPSDPPFTDISGLDTDGSSTNASFTYQTGTGASAYYLVAVSTSGGQLGPVCSYPNPAPSPTCP